MAENPKKQPLTAVKGMNDLLPPDSAHWEWLEDRVRTLSLPAGARVDIAVSVGFGAAVPARAYRLGVTPPTL